MFLPLLGNNYTWGIIWSIVIWVLNTAPGRWQSEAVIKEFRWKKLDFFPPLFFTTLNVLFLSPITFNLLDANRPFGLVLVPFIIKVYSIFFNHAGGVARRMAMSVCPWGGHFGPDLKYLNNYSLYWLWDLVQVLMVPKGRSPLTLVVPWLTPPPPTTTTPIYLIDWHKICYRRSQTW